MCTYDRSRKSVSHADMYKTSNASPTGGEGISMAASESGSLSVRSIMAPGMPYLLPIEYVGRREEGEQNSPPTPQHLV